MKQSLRLVAGLLLVTLSFLPAFLPTVTVAQDNDNSSVKQDVKDVGHSAKQATKTTGRKVKRTTKRIVSKSASKTAETADKVADKTKQ